MSFWPFSNSFNSNSKLRKVLDQIVDLSKTTVDDFLLDPETLQELVSELHSIKASYNNRKNNVLQLQLQRNQDSNWNGSDLISVTSSTNENSNNRDGQGAKLLEILLEPHILTGFMDYIVDSVEFFNNLSKQRESEEELREKPASISDEVMVEQAEVTDNNGEEEQEQDEEESEEDRIRRCILVSSEILSVDLWLISNRIIETPVIMEKLWLILYIPHLSDSLPTVTYLVHILDQLMDTNSIELLNFVRRQPDLVDMFLSMIEVPMIMDFFLRIIQTDKAESPTGIIENLAQQNLIPKLINILKPHPSQFEASCEIPNHELFFRQTAAADFLRALVTISSNTALATVLETNIGPNLLTHELVSPTIIKTMIKDIMLYQPPPALTRYASKTNKHGINNCVGIIIEIIRKNNSDYDLNCGSYSSLLQNSSGDGPTEVNSYVMFQWLKDFEQNPPGPRDPIYLGEMLTIFSDHLDDFVGLMDIAEEEPNKLGFTRFKIAELVAELLHCSNMILLNSKKIRKIMKVREHVRFQRDRRLKKALKESLPTSIEHKDGAVDALASGLDDVSLFDLKSEDDDDGLIISDLVSSLDQDVSDDEEPVISPEEPFVCKERDTETRKDPCVGDYFKIKLTDLNIVLQIIGNFTRFPWHNFFHNVVFDLIQQVFNGKLNSYNSFIIVDLFRPEKHNLTKMVVDAYREAGEPRPGYMGHLILISEEIVKFTSLYKPDLISPVIVSAVSTADWEWFVGDVLLKTRELYNVVLGAESEEGTNAGNDEDENESYGFDSSTVGYIDLGAYEGKTKKNTILLGDRTNHNLFINEQGHENDTEDETIDHEVPDVGRMSPGNVATMNDELEGDDGAFRDYDDVENLSGSDSSDDEEDDGNKLRRVPKHNE